MAKLERIQYIYGLKNCMIENICVKNLVDLTKYIETESDRYIKWPSILSIYFCAIFYILWINNKSMNGSKVWN